jgi:dihydropteroate synthase
MYFAPRLLQIENEEGARRELLALGLDPARANRLAPELLRGGIRLSAVSPDCLEGLRLISKTLDGLELCASAPNTLGDTDLLLIGSFRQLKRLCDTLRADPLTRALAADLSILLSGKPPQFLQGRACRLKLDRPLIMGVLNITPDSFFPAGRCADLESALRRGATLAEQGADLLDVGGESTRPGAPAVSEAEELDRVVPLIEGLKREIDLPISIDTTKSRVAREAVAAGADFINDISALRFDHAMAETAAQCGAGIFLMHTRGRPDRMQEDTCYRDLVGEVLLYLHEGIALARSAGVPLDKLAIDPGIGFGKSVEGNLEILRRLREFTSLGRPVLLGTSRKGFIGRILDRPNPDDRLFGTVATVALGVAAGAHLFRVHDVQAAREAAMVAWAVRNVV